jgi:hypothetical protein
MARFTAQINVGENVYRTYKASSASVSDNDIGKPVKISATDTVALCADGDQIYGFIAAVNPQTADGYPVVSVLVSGRCWVILSGASAIGTVVEAAANTAAGVAKAGSFGLVSTHTIVTATKKLWEVVSGTGADGATVLIEKL